MRGRCPVIRHAAWIFCMKMDCGCQTTYRGSTGSAQKMQAQLSVSQAFCSIGLAVMLRPQRLQRD